jgi:predicted ester cyclase
MTDEQKALVERLRNYGDCLDYQIHEDRTEAADLIDAQAAENARLREALQNSNKQAEHFERKWYLCGDEVDRLRERLTQAIERLRDMLQCDDGQAWDEAERFVDIIAQETQS